jgi:hypothetical protein
MEAHLASCQECRTQLGQYQKLSAVLEEDRMGASPELQTRIWNKIAAQSPVRDFRAGNNNRIWKRSVSLPVPLAAAAAAVFVVALFLAVQAMQYAGRTTNPNQEFASYGITASIGADAEEMLTMSDMNSVLQYLSRQESSDFVFIDLPENRNFSSYGEPAFLRADDYSKRRPRR